MGAKLRAWLASVENSVLSWNGLPGAASTTTRRFVQHMPAAREAMPAGDFRDWPAIDAWAAQIAAELKAQLASAQRPGK